MKFKQLLSSLVVACMLFTSASFAEAKVINQGNPDIKEMALTFDDGYSVEKIRQIQKKLDQHGVKGTFFFVGSFMASNKEIVRELEEAGHMVVSHSYSHKNFTKISDKVMVGEIENVKIAYNKATDKKMLPYFRPPYGAYNDHVLQTLGKNHDLYVVMWSIDTLDWKGLSPEQINNTVFKNAGNGKIVLMHTTKHVKTDQALDQMITGLQDKGYKLVRIDEMLIKLPENKRLKNIDQMYHEQQGASKSLPVSDSAFKEKPVDSSSKDDSANSQSQTGQSPKQPSAQNTNSDGAKAKDSGSNLNFIHRYLWRLILSR